MRSIRIEDTIIKGDIKMDKQYLKKTPEELQEYMSFKRRHGIVPNKKGKAAFKRSSKHKKNNFNEE